MEHHPNVTVIVPDTFAITAGARSLQYGTPARRHFEGQHGVASYRAIWYGTGLSAALVQSNGPQESNKTTTAVLCHQPKGGRAHLRKKEQKPGHGDCNATSTCKEEAIHSRGHATLPAPRAACSLPEPEDAVPGRVWGDIPAANQQPAAWARAKQASMHLPAAPMQPNWEPIAQRAVASTCKQARKLRRSPICPPAAAKVLPDGLQQGARIGAVVITQHRLQRLSGFL